MAPSAPSFLPGFHSLHVVVIGLDSAGKTSLLYRLKLKEFVKTIPTKGFNTEKVRVPVGTSRSICFQVWDVGGQEKLRPLWKSYTRRTDGHGVRGGLHGAGEDGGGPGGAAQDHAHLREPRGARAHPGQQAGFGLGAVGERGGEAAVGARAEHVHAASRAGLQRRGRAGAPAGPGETSRDDPEEEEDDEAQQEQEEVNCPGVAGDFQALKEELFS
ncbi:hypothetical protein fugu_000325 [Takifugu bimaculatus]|uniref:ADP-ribosylation factor-like protein 4C n=1 Tax=Takifugu bimaculatus TaxID=433685 RepID=A0A4Z2CGE5_9TELE|nr:hypothetical protein fugu_000325 [Takifugu bimaculatus]